MCGAQRCVEDLDARGQEGKEQINIQRFDPTKAHANHVMKVSPGSQQHTSEVSTGFVGHGAPGMKGLCSCLEERTECQAAAHQQDEQPDQVQDHAWRQTIVPC